jgi:hypothetical protein
MMRITRLVRPGLNPVTVRDAIANASDLARRKRRSCYNRSRQNNLPKHIHNHVINIIKKMFGIHPLPKNSNAPLEFFP